MSPRHGSPARRKSYSARAHDTHARRRLTFGVDGPPAGKGERLVLCAWNTTCGHVVVIAKGDSWEDGFPVGLVVGLLAPAEVRARSVRCLACTPPEQAELAL
ncbi:MAG: hypothetical protein EPN91_07935 [Salinibacterium sp.]|nr:MAG: hypothetical protein EPN91_07935 [Salinibacterium sp.]